MVWRWMNRGLEVLNNYRVSITPYLPYFVALNWCGTSVMCRSSTSQASEKRSKSSRRSPRSAYSLLLAFFSKLTSEYFRSHYADIGLCAQIPLQQPYMKERVELSAFASDETVQALLKDMEDQFAARFSACALSSSRSISLFLHSSPPLPPLPAICNLRNNTDLPPGRSMFV